MSNLSLSSTVGSGFHDIKIRRDTIVGYRRYDYDAFVKVETTKASEKTDGLGGSPHPETESSAKDQHVVVIQVEAAHPEAVASTPSARSKEQALPHPRTRALFPEATPRWWGINE